MRYAHSANLAEQSPKRLEVGLQSEEWTELCGETVRCALTWSGRQCDAEELQDGRRTVERPEAWCGEQAMKRCSELSTRQRAASRARGSKECGAASHAQKTLCAAQ